MPTIILETIIKSNIDTCFDLSRSIDLHEISTANTNERAIDGTTSGLINLNECVTWKAKHFGVTQTLTSKITAFDRPHHFRDEQQKEAFKYIIHDHYFKAFADKVIMKDIFKFQSPLGYIGKLIDKLLLTGYLKKLLLHRNEIIKEYAESEKWKSLLVK